MGRRLATGPPVEPSSHRPASGSWLICHSRGSTDEENVGAIVVLIDGRLEDILTERDLVEAVGGGLDPPLWS